MRVFLNGKEIRFAEGGYTYVFLKPYQKYVQDTVKKNNGELFLQLYDNGVQIRTLVTPNEVSTIINREVAVDPVNKKIYILEENTQYKTEADGSVSIIE